MVNGSTPSSESDETKRRPHSPSLQAEIHLLARQELGTRAKSLIPNRVTARGYTQLSSFLDDLSGKVAVVVIDVTLAESNVREAVARTVKKSEHARVALLATDGAQLLRSEVPYDEAFVFPDETETFKSDIKNLYIRSYYAATMERYYKICFSIQNQKTTTEKPEENEQIRRLKGARDRLESHLQLFRRVLTEEDMDAISNREHRLKSLSKSAKNNPPPDAVGLPDACPDCGLDWTAWHGSKLRNGYERIGADTWRCVNCGRVLDDMDPDHYKIA
ncbi:hypothetical protein SAMN05216226_10766 [Halovenus aranensis]|uniref:Halobacterial output domain-containing protein n=1 Tax=Halovenus aranensis TaxID=890420 RepID=A0A1G8VP05_9EURY|nr:hypothetical protein [Halovenus aranensis]SDJ67806.1 hypothetical protein SAMN05216226_10766 [Halovenus aranensis]